MKIKILVVLLASIWLISSFKIMTKEQFDSRDAWEELEGVLKQQYAYLDRPEFNVQLLFSEFEVRAIGTTNKQEFADEMQMFLRHFHDPHLNLGPYNENDFSVYPTGSDIRAIYKSNKFFVEDIKSNSAADIAGIRPGAEILTIESVPAKQAIEKVFGKKLEQLSLAQINFGINVSLGGYRNSKRTISLQEHGKIETYHLAPSYDSINAMKKGPTVTYKELDSIAYIRFNNSLGNANTVKDFKQAITALSNTKALIIDLRNTPSGGNTSVAEPILGHFVDSKTAYQLYQIQEAGSSYKDANMEKAYVYPNKPRYAKPFVVLAGHWTGSMGEGMTIGLDAIGAVNVIGAPMADLLGGIKTVKLAKSDTWLELGFERLYHVNNTLREDFEPNIMISPADRDVHGNDPALSLAMKVIADLFVESR